MRFRCCNVEHGWMDIVVETDHTSYTMDVSDVMNDCITGLVTAAIRLNKGEDIAQVLFWSEPATDTWHIVRDGESLHIKHYWTRETIDELPQPESKLGQLEDECTTTLSEFTNQVIRLVTRFSEIIEQEQADVNTAWTAPYSEKEVKILKELRRRKHNGH